MSLNAFGRWHSDLGTPATAQRARWLTRRRVIARGATAAGAILAACDSPQAQQSAEPVTVSYWTDWSGSPRGDWLARAMPLFEQESPKIKTTIQNTSGLQINTAIVANAAAGTLADVILGWNALLPYLATNKVLADVAPWLRTSKLDLNDLTVLTSSIKYANVTYGLPFQATVDGFVYNKTLFQREGVPLPTEAWTWDNVIDAAKRLTDASARRWGIGSVAPHWAHWGWVVESAGGKIISDDGKKTLLNSPLVIEAFQHRVDLILKHQVAPPLNATGLSFQAGNLAINLNRTPKALIPLIVSQFEWDVMYIPKWPKNGKRVVRQDDQANWLTDAGKKRGHGDQAFQLMKWMSTSEASQRLIVELSVCHPVLKKMARQSPFISPPPASMNIFNDQVERFGGWTDPVFMYGELWYRAMVDQITPAYSGEKSVPEVLELATREGDRILARGYEGVS